MKRLLTIIACVLTLVWVGMPAIEAQRRITPVTAPDPRRQPVDSALVKKRELEQRRARSVHYHDASGRAVMVDTVTGTEWVDSTLLPPPPKMKYPLLYDVTVGVNIWDAIMRAFGQKYGGVDFAASLNMHNRYFPTFEAGLGMARNTPSGNNYTYRSPIAPYFKIGLDYNFIYNSDPAYKFFAGVRYGFSAFSYEITDAELSGGYWDETIKFDIPSQKVTAGWFEVGIGLRVKLWGPISAGWSVKYHTLLHHSTPASGDPWYVPGYGTFGSALSGAFTLSYTIGLNKSRPVEVNKTEPAQPDIVPEHSDRRSTKSTVNGGDTDSNAAPTTNDVNPE